LEKRQVGKRFQYLVKWEGYSIEQATWEPASNLSNVKSMIKEFEMGLEMGTTSAQCQSTNTSNSAQQLPTSNKKTLVAVPPISQTSK
jgi:hypothetical protein